MSEEKEAIQKLYKWHDSFAASPPDTPMQAVDGIIHSRQSWFDAFARENTKVKDLEARIQKCRDYMDEIDSSLEFAWNPEKFELQFRAARKLMDFLEDK